MQQDQNWYIITKDKEGLSGLWRKITKDPTYEEFGANFVSLPAGADFDKDVAPRMKEINGKNKTSFVVQADDAQDAAQAAYSTGFINAGQRASLLAKIKPQPQKPNQQKPGL